MQGQASVKNFRLKTFTVGQFGISRMQQKISLITEGTGLQYLGNKNKKNQCFSGGIQQVSDLDLYRC